MVVFMETLHNTSTQSTETTVTNQPKKFTNQSSILQIQKIGKIGINNRISYPIKKENCEINYPKYDPKKVIGIANSIKEELNGYHLETLSRHAGLDNLTSDEQGQWIAALNIIGYGDRCMLSNTDLRQSFESVGGGQETLLDFITRNESDIKQIIAKVEKYSDAENYSPADPFWQRAMVRFAQEKNLQINPDPNLEYDDFALLGITGEDFVASENSLYAKTPQETYNTRRNSKTNLFVDPHDLSHIVGARYDMYPELHNSPTKTDVVENDGRVGLFKCPDDLADIIYTDDPEKFSAFGIYLQTTKNIVKNIPNLGENVDIDLNIASDEIFDFLVQNSINIRELTMLAEVSMGESDATLLEEYLFSVGIQNQKIFLIELVKLKIQRELINNTKTLLDKFLL